MLLFVSRGASILFCIVRQDALQDVVSASPAYIQECLRVAMIPESFLTAEASERSRAANVSAEFAGIGAGFGGSVTRGDRMSQKVSEKRCHCRASMPIFNGTYDVLTPVTARLKREPTSRAHQTRSTLYPSMLDPKHKSYR